MEVILENNTESKELMNMTSPARNNAETMAIESNVETDLKDSTHDEMPKEYDSEVKSHAETNHTNDSTKKHLEPLSNDRHQTVKPCQTTTDSKESHQEAESFVQVTTKEFEHDKSSLRSPKPNAQTHQEDEDQDQQKDGNMSPGNFIQTEAPHASTENPNLSMDYQPNQGAMSQEAEYDFQHAEEEIVNSTNEMQLENEHLSKPMEQANQAHLSLKELTKAGLLEPENEEQDVNVHENHDSVAPNTQLPLINSEVNSGSKKAEMEEEEPLTQQANPKETSCQNNEARNTEIDMETPKKTENSAIQKLRAHLSTLTKKSDTERTSKVSLLDSIKKSVENKERSLLKSKEETLALEKSQAKSETQKIRDSTPKRDEAQANQESREKYSIGEDVKILDYIKANKGANPTSRIFWHTALENDKFLNQKRSAESLRERYRKQLSCLTDTDIQRMHKWISQNGERGSITFKTKAMQESSGKIVYVKGLDTIEPEPNQTQSSNASRGKSNMKETTQEKAKTLEKQVTSSEKTSNISEKKPTEKGSVPDKSKESQSLSKSNQKESLLTAFNREAQKNKMDLEMLGSGHKGKEDKENQKLSNNTSKNTPKVLHENGIVELKEISVQNTSANKTLTKESQPKSEMKNEKNFKRKEYQDMQEVDQKMMLRKATKEEPVPQSMSAAELLEMTKKEKEQVSSAEKKKTDNVLDKEAWLEQQAKKYHMTSDEMTDLFYYCSMDTNILSKYLQGEKLLAWNEDEDTLLRGPAKTYARKILGRYKGEANVKQRVEFLEKIDQLSAVIQSSSEKKQSSSAHQNTRAFA